MITNKDMCTHKFKGLMNMNDLISRQAAIAQFKPYALYDSNRTNAEWVTRIEAVLEQLPSAEKRGKWLPHPTDTDWNVCSVCGIGTHTRFHYNEGVYGGYDVEESFWYCPHCGARME